YTNTTIHWGLATALGGLLLAATRVLYVVYSWLVGASTLRLGYTTVCAAGHLMPLSRLRERVPEGRERVLVSAPLLLGNRTREEGA
ncbi:MAG: hypothetical protein IIZ69_04445, partial [Pseudomonas sp.]|nr:hypothetical protein [Pseudomonas sp.]